jgi:hypothetical protein
VYFIWKSVGKLVGISLDVIFRVFHLKISWESVGL